MKRILVGLLAATLFCAPALAADKTPLASYPGEPTQPLKTGDDVPPAHGGTGLSSLTAHCVVIGAGTSAAHLVCPSTSGNVLTDHGASADPSFDTPTGGSGTVTSIICGTGLSGGTITTTGTCSITAPVTVALGGTNATSASGTALDNITGFSSTGFLTRTGAGTYSFQSATNGITLGNLAQIGANTVLGNATGSTANIAAQSMPSCSAASSALTWTTSSGFGCNTITASPTFANPTATAGPTAINGSATTAMRSDAAPPVQLGTNSQPGLLQGDGSTTNVSAGVVSVIGAPIGVNYSTPSLASFTWLNQGTATATQTVANQAISLATNNSSQVSILYISAPATPYRVRARMVGYPKAGANSTQFGGIGFYDGTKLTSMGSFGNSASMIIAHIATITTGSGAWGGGVTNSGGASFMLMPPAWVQIRNDGTTLYYDMSVDGQNFTNMFSEAIGTYISSPTNIWWGGAGVSGLGGVVSLLNWTVSNTASLN